jgi:hypothetical protein
LDVPMDVVAADLVEDPVRFEDGPHLGLDAGEP